jgi:DNA-binding SARP family transcriptional activator
MTPRVSISVMGCLELRSGDRVMTPSAPKLRSLLALLALRNNHVVTTGTLMEEIWGNNPPVSALATLQTYIYQLRRVLTVLSPASAILETRPLGYMITIERDELDWNLFQDHAKDGRAALDRGDAAAAAIALGRALALSQAAPLADVEAGSMLSAYVNELTETKLQALELRVEADLQLGRYRELVGELKTLITEYPFHEGLYSKLMLSLERSGRRFEALEVYQQLRTTLVDELGLEPSAKVRQLQFRLLAADDARRAVPQPETPMAASAPSGRAYPAQLPADLPDFTGREATVAMLCGLALGTDSTPPARLLNITGMVGVGKSAVTLRVAHRIRNQFTDGQFYADLGASSDRPVDPFSVLGRFLSATGRSDAELPGDLDERAQLFRSWTADRNVLVVLDDAGRATDIRPLLPAGALCTAIVATGQHCLTGLDGAKVLELEPLEPHSCIELLSTLIGHDRVQQEEEMAHSIVTLCGRLPLAIRVIGTKLASSPHYPLRRIVVRLSDQRRLLPELRIGGIDIAARIARDYGRLSPGAQQLVSDLVHGGTEPYFPVGVAAALCDLDAFSTELLLEELARACFLRAVDLDGYGTAGYSVPTIIRSFVLQDMLDNVAVS